MRDTTVDSEPDAHLGPVALAWMSMGQLLTIPMIIFGGLLIFGLFSKGK